MAELEKKTHNQIPLYCIRFIGFLSILVALRGLLNAAGSNDIYINLSITALFYLIFSPWAVTLPSGASWRPAMAFIFFSILNFDYRLVILVAIPGTILNSWGKKDFLNRFLLTLGHLAIGIYLSGLVSALINIKFTTSILSYISITVSLLAFFCANRLIAAIIVAVRKQISYLKQIYLIKDDLNWGYSCAYVLGILMYLVFRVYYLPGLLLVIVLLITIYQALTYYIKLKDIEEKIYVDGLTEAENRLSWEEFLSHNNYMSESGMIFMMDLDNFKMINDTYGHNLGDQILQQFVNHVKREMKRTYRLFRYGGDEFILVVFFPEEDGEDAFLEITKTLDIENEVWNSKEMVVSVSFGNAKITASESIEDIVRKADKAMYLNKSNKNKIRNIHS